MRAVGPLVVLACTVALACAGCGTKAPAAPAEPAQGATGSVTTAAAVEASSAPEPVVADPCASWSGSDVVAALSTNKHEPATETPIDQRQFTCGWDLPKSLRDELGIRGLSGEDLDGENFVIQLHPYGDQTYGIGTYEYSVPTPQDLIANIAPGYEGAEVLPGSPPALFNGISGVVVATPGDAWAHLTLFGCGADDCGAAAIRAARILLQD